jgi:hypothetical protein
MAVTLAQSATLSSNMIQRGVIETFIENSPVLDRLPLMEIEGNAYAYRRENALPGIAFRAVNAAYTESTGAFSELTESLAIMGGEADVDRFIQQTRSNFEDQRAAQLRLKTKALAYKFNETFFEGDIAVDANSFDGLRKRLTGNQVVTAGANGATLTLDMIDDLISRVVGGPDVIYANSFMIRKINALLRASGVTVMVTDLADARRLATSYAGIPIVDPGVAADGTTDILNFDETQGTDTTIDTSIYAVRFGEEEFVSGLTNGGVQVDDLGLLESKPAYRTRVEFYCGMAIFNGKAAARLKGLRQA